MQREVGGSQLAGRVDLIEEDLLGRTLGGPPRFDLPLQGAELAVGEPAREPALEILEEGLGLEPGIELQQVAEFGPDVLERILPGPPGSWGERFTGQPLGMPVLSSRLGVHTHLQGRTIEWMSFAEKLAKLANLGVLDHGGSLLGSGGNHIVNRRARGGGNSNCRWEGILIVADHLPRHLPAPQRSSGKTEPGTFSWS